MSNWFVLFGDSGILLLVSNQSSVGPVAGHACQGLMQIADHEGQYHINFESMFGQGASRQKGTRDVVCPSSFCVQVLIEANLKLARAYAIHDEEAMSTTAGWSIPSESGERDGYSQLVS
jgi:hypothetical protein